MRSLGLGIMRTSCDVTAAFSPCPLVPSKKFSFPVVIEEVRRVKIFLFLIFGELAVNYFIHLVHFEAILFKALKN